MIYKIQYKPQHDIDVLETIEVDGKFEAFGQKSIRWLDFKVTKGDFEQSESMLILDTSIYVEDAKELVKALNLAISDAENWSE
jgi:hypothetical protein